MWLRDPPIVTPEPVTAPVAEPVSLAELKLHCRVDVDDDDEYVRALGVAARQYFENALDRQLVTATWKIRLPRFYAWQIELPYPPLRSVVSISYKDLANATQTVNASTYDVVTWATPGYVQPKITAIWPPTAIDPGAVTITFSAGYGAATAVPELVKSGIKLLVEHWFIYREPVTEGLMSTLPFGIDSIVASARAYRF